MIDHIHNTSNMNVLGKLNPTNEFGYRFVRQSRRFSCMNPVLANGQDGALGSPKMGKRRQSAGLIGQEQSPDENTHQQQVNWRPKQRALFTATAAGKPLPVLETNEKALDKQLRSLPLEVRAYVEAKAKLVKCRDVHVCDGSQTERQWLIRRMASQNMIRPLKKRENCWLARTDPRDVARVESKTFICTRNKRDVVARGTDEDKPSCLGNWMHLDELDEKMDKLLAGCMAGRTMYVIPFSMGPFGSKLSKVGIQLTDSPYVVVSMHIMTRVSRKVFQLIEGQGDFVACFHSVGCPLPLQRPLVNNWPCNPEETIISHVPERKEIISYGSGYGGNSLLGKKCFALRLGSILGRQEGWLAEHMLIMGVTSPSGDKKYIAAAFPSACGKTNLAMMTPSLPGYKVECVGDDIAWMRFDKQGVLRAINPEAGFFGVAPGTNEASNPNAMKTVERNTIFTNVAETDDGDFFWEGLEHQLADKPTKQVTDWQGNKWSPQEAAASGSKAAHPNSRFCSPASQCPIIDPQWESPEGVPISAIIFGGRRPEGVPLVYESFDWNHGVFVGASMRSETTAAAEHKGKSIMHDPFAMRPFFGYNFGLYLDHWLSFGRTTNSNLKLPKIFHVNWFRKDAESGKFLWPGFGENSRVLDWICRRISNNDQSSAIKTPIGYVPTKESFNVTGLKEHVDLEELFSVSSEFWLQEQQMIEQYLRVNVGKDLPSEIVEEIHKLRQRLLEQQTTSS